MTRPGIARRRWLARVALASLLPSLMPSRSRGASPSWRLREAPIASRVARLQPGGPHGVLVVGVDGTLSSIAQVDASATPIGRDIDPTTPMAVGHGRIAARTSDGRLRTWDGERTRTADGPPIAARAGLAVLPLAIVAVVVDRESHRLVRLERPGRSWIESARSAMAVLPDTRPSQVALDPRDDAGDGHIVVFAGPDASRYDHGVLGDRIEATRLLWLERHDLTVLRELALPEPHVFEDIAPRVVRTDEGQGLLTMRSGGSGTRLALVTADPSRRDRLIVAALGDSLGAPHRWLAPTTDGRRLLAVHTPHVDGVLNVYRRDGDRLVARVVARDVANHRIGTRDLDLSCWVGSSLTMPSQDGRTLRVFDAVADYAERDAIALPSRVTATAALPDASGVAALLDDGRVIAVTRRTFDG